MSSLSRAWREEHRRHLAWLKKVHVQMYGLLAALDYDSLTRGVKSYRHFWYHDE